jgi:predicted DNA-binding transcriptional regulator AlpA
MPVPTVYAYVGRGKIPPDCIKRIGRSLKFDRVAVDQWINAQR